jgi:hypothetical protein
MITWGSWMIGCCLLAQVGDGSARPDRSPRLVPKRPAPAARFDATRSDPNESIDDSRQPGSTYPSEPAERTLEELDPAKRDRTGMERVGGGPRKLRPPELLAEAIATPADGRLKGRPIALVDVLARVNDRAAQRNAVVVYWRLAIAQGQYHYALAARDRLRRWAETRHKVTTLAESQLASAEAAVDDAEFNILKAGAELAALVGLEDSDRTPWAVDRPHVGAYDLKYEQLFAGKNVPGRLRLIHRTLPIGRRAIDVHGEAVVAAVDALDATEEEYRQGAADYQTVAAWLDRLTTERKAFLQSVLRYNDDIAEYAFSVAPAEADAKLLANILIRQPAKSTLAAAPRDRGESPAGGNPDAPLPSQRDGIPPTFREEDVPPEQPIIEDSGFRESRRGDIGPRDSRLNYRSSARPQFLLVQLPAAGNRTGQPHAGGQSRTAAPSHAAGPAHATEQSHGGLYQGLLNSKAAERAQKLSELLHWDRELPAESGDKAPLAAALAQVVSTSERRAVITAYWQTRERIARFLVLSELGESLTALAPHVLGLRSQPGGTAAMLRLQAARQAAQAAVLDEQIGMLTSEFDLTRFAKNPVERPWIRPVTAPYSGAFDVAANTARSANKSAAAGAATRVVTLHLELQNQALAVVFADEYRAEMAATSEHQAATIDHTLAAIERQLHETDRFLIALTHYNLAIADFAFASLPPGVPTDRLVDALVPSPRRSAGG